MAVEIANAVVNITPSFRGLQRSLEQEIRGADTDRAGRDAGDSYTSGFSGAAKKIGGVLAAAFAGAKIVDFGKDAIANASDLNEVGTKLSAVFGDAATDITAFGAQGAKALGQTSLQAQNAAATFGTFGKAAGLSNKENAAFSTELAKLATDMASFSNTTPEQAIEALGAGLRGESEPLRSYGVLLDDASLRQEALAQGLITTTKEALTPQQKVLAAHALIMKQTSDAQGDFERTSGGLANQQRILAAQWEDAKGKLGQAFLPAVTSVVSSLNDNLFPALDSMGAKATAAWDLLKTGDFTGSSAGLGEEDSPLVKGLFFARNTYTSVAPEVEAAWNLLKTGDFPGSSAGLGEEDSPLVAGLLKAHEVFASVGPDLQAAWKTLLTGDTFGVSADELGPITQIASILHDTFAPMIASLGPIFKEVGATLGPVFVQVFDTLAPAIKELLPSLAQLLPLFNPVGLLFKALIPILPQIADLLGQVATVVADVLAEALKSVGPLIDTIVGAFQEFMPIIVNLAASLLPPLIGLFKSLLPVLPPIAKVIAELAKVLAEGLAQALQAVAPLFTTLVGVINRFVPFIGKLVESLLPPLLNLFDKLAPLLEVILAALMPVIDALVAALIPAIEALLPVVEIVFGFIATTIQNVMQVISGVIDVIIGIFTGDWQKVWDGVLQIFSGVWDQIKNVISTIGDLFYQFFTNIGPTIWGILVSLGSTIVGWGTQFLQWLWDGIVSLFPDILDWFSELPGWIWEKVVALTNVIFDYGVQFLQWIWDGIVDLFPKVLDWFASLPGWAWDKIVALASSIVNYGGQFIGWIKDGIVNGAVAIFDWFTNLPALIGTKIVEIGSKLLELGKDLVGYIVDGVVAVAGDIWSAITDALTSDAGLPEDSLTGASTPGVVPGGSDRGGVVGGHAAGGVVPGRDPGRRDNVLARLPDGKAWGLRSEESVFVPEFTHAIGGAPVVNAWNRAAEQGRLGDVMPGFALGGVVGQSAKLKAFGSALAWDQAHKFIAGVKDGSIGGSAGLTYDGNLTVGGYTVPLPSGVRGKFMQAVASKMGTEYVWGAAGPNVFDCSGLMSWALEQAGAGIGRLTAENFNSRFPHISTAKPGDMVTFDTGRLPGQAGHIGAVLDPAKGLMMNTDGAGPASVASYVGRDGGPLSIIDPIGGSVTPSVPQAAQPGDPPEKGFFAKIFAKASAALGLGSSVGSGLAGFGGSGGATRLLNTVDPIQDFGAMNMARGTADMVGPLPAGGAEDRWAGLYTKILNDKGKFSPANLANMMYQMHTESGGNPLAYNGYDSNYTRGHPSKSLLQTIPSTFRAYADPGYDTNIWDPESNGRAAVNYVAARYGGVFPGHAYDTGGWMSPGGMGVNLLNKPEAVLTPGQSDAYVRHAQDLEAGFNGGVTVVIDNSDPLQRAFKEMLDNSRREQSRNILTSLGQGL